MQTRREPNYAGVYLVLVIATGIEVLVTYLAGLEGSLRVSILVALSALKAALVAMWYMHLRFDSRWYALIMGFGAFFGVALIFTFIF